MAAGPVYGEGTQLYLDLESTLLGPGIPPNCSAWHELYPTHCASHHQDGYNDADSDGMISPCDMITLNGVTYHIVWVGPTYFLTCLPQGEQVVYEPMGDPSGGNPICEVWHEIFPNFCQETHVESWQDNGDGVLSPCDIVDWQGMNYHLDRIGLNIIVVPGPVSVDPESWGEMKDRYRN